MKKPWRSIFNGRPQSSGHDSVFRHCIFEITFAIIISIILVVFLYSVTIPTRVLGQGNVTGTTPMFPSITKSTQTNGSSSSNSNITTTNTTPGLPPLSRSTPTNTSTTANNFSTYENSTYGIKISYPSDWIKEESHNQSSGNVVLFYTPPSAATYAFLDLTTASAHHLPLDQLTNVSIYDLKNELKNFTLISSNATTLAGSPAQKIVYDAFVPSGLKLKVMQLITIKNDTSFVITAAAFPQEFSSSLPVTQKMIDSFTFIPVSSTTASPASNLTSNATTSGNLPPVPTVNNTQSSAANATQTYTNSTDGISLTTPQGWTTEAGQNLANATLLTVVTLAPPISQDPNALMQIVAEKDTNPSTNSSIDQYLRDTINAYRSNPSNNFKLLSANTGFNLAGHPAYQLVWTYTPQAAGIGPSEDLEVGLLLKGKAYIVDYYGPVQLFPKFLPQAQQIIKSLAVNPPA